MAGTLYLVGTPLGNLEDLTFRALRTLKEADLILAEDTRVTRKLLAHFDVHTPLRRLIENDRGINELLAELADGRQMALVVDAGMPGVSDPGARAVAEAVDRGFKVVPVPGPTALTTALSACDLPFDEFTFLGFPPTKKGRQTFFKSLSREPHRLLVLYESPHRLLYTLDELINNVGDRQVVIARELTKLHEEFFRGSLTEARDYFTRSGLKGEFVIIIAPS